MNDDFARLKAGKVIIFYAFTDIKFRHIKVF